MNRTAQSDTKNHCTMRLAKWPTHQSCGSRGRPKSVLVVLQTSFTTSKSLQISNCVCTSFISFSEMNIVGLDFKLRQEQSPSSLITTNRSSHVPIICDFLKMRSKHAAPSRCSALYSCTAVLRSAGCNFTSFACSLARTTRRKISYDRSFGPSSSFSRQVSANSSSTSTILTLRLGFPSSSERQRWARTSFEQGIVRLLTSNSFSRRRSSVSTLSFLSSSLTGQAGESWWREALCSFPRERLLSPFLGCLTSAISSSLLRQFQSEEEVPNSSRLMRMSSCLRLSFILMYSSCWRLNSASFSSSLSPPAKSSFALTCLQTTSPAPTSFLALCPSTSELFTPSLISPPDYKHTSAYNPKLSSHCGAAERGAEKAIINILPDEEGKQADAQPVGPSAPPATRAGHGAEDRAVPPHFPPQPQLPRLRPRPARAAARGAERPALRGKHEADPPAREHRAEDRDQEVPADQPQLPQAQVPHHQPLPLLLQPQGQDYRRLPQRGGAVRGERAADHEHRVHGAEDPVLDHAEGAQLERAGEGEETRGGEKDTREVQGHLEGAGQDRQDEGGRPQRVDLVPRRPCPRRLLRGRARCWSNDLLIKYYLFFVWVQASQEASVRGASWPRSGDFRTQVERQVVQRSAAVLALQESLHGQLHGQGTGRREDRSRVQTAQLRRAQGRESDAQEERQEGRRLRALGRLPQLPRRERRGPRRRLRQEGQVQGRYSGHPFQGGRREGHLAARPFHRQEGEEVISLPDLSTSIPHAPPHATPPRFQILASHYSYFDCYRMSRRPVSPIRTASRSESDPRDAMIRKLKEDLIVARGREKELAILENYLVELIEKTKLLSAETAKTDEEGKLKLELTVKSINELKKEVDGLRAELRNTSNELGEVEEEEAELKRSLNSKLIEIEKLKKEGLSLHADNEKLLNEHYRLRSQEDEIVHEIRKLGEAIRDYEGRLSEINRKVLEVKSYINEMSEENSLLKEKLRGYEQENAGIDSDLDQKENRIDLLEKTFADKHELIKSQVENYIELEHHNEKNLKETRHKTNLLKIEGEKHNELTNVVKKFERTIAEKTKELDQVRAESSHIIQVNTEFATQNAKMKADLAYCQEHLQNLLKHNAYIQEEMENYVREDEAIINVIRRKRLISSNNYGSLRSSRNGQLSARNYQ